MTYIISNSASFAFRPRKPFIALLGETFEIFDEDRNFMSLTEWVSYDPPTFVMHALNEYAELNLKITVKPEFKETYFENCFRDDV